MPAKFTHRERGASFVEFVLIVPFFLMLVFGIISFGVMLSFRQTMSQAATEGARAAAVAPSNLTYSQRRDRAISAINESFQGQIGGTLTCGAILTCTIPNVPVTCGDSNQCISITLSYPYRDHPRVEVSQFFGFTLPQTVSYSSSARIN